MIALIVAMSKNRVIGHKGTIPWNIPEELQRFKELTTDNVVIMGRRTYEDIGRPLPNREIIIVTTTQYYEADNLKTARSLKEAIELAGNKDIYISGGSRLYEEAIPLVDKMYITEVDLEVEGDTYFPYFDGSLFTREIEAVYPKYTYLTYTRKKAVE